MPMDSYSPANQLWACVGIAMMYSGPAGEAHFGHRAAERIKLLYASSGANGYTQLAGVAMLRTLVNAVEYPSVLIIMHAAVTVGWMQTVIDPTHVGWLRALQPWKVPFGYATVLFVVISIIVSLSRRVIWRPYTVGLLVATSLLLYSCDGVLWFWLVCLAMFSLGYEYQWSVYYEREQIATQSWRTAPIDAADYEEIDGHLGFYFPAFEGAVLLSTLLFSGFCLALLSSAPAGLTLLVLLPGLVLIRFLPRHDLFHSLGGAHIGRGISEAMRGRATVV